MDLCLITRVLSLRAAWRRRDHWDADRITAHQEHALQELRRAAYAGSEFYRRHHAGLHDAPLNRLPSVTKAELMEHFDEAVTTPNLRLADLENHLRSLTERGGDPGTPWKGRWWAAATAGTTGRRGTFVWNRAEWATVLASYARANDWAGISAGLTQPLKMALASSRVPTHQSAVVGASLRSRLRAHPPPGRYRAHGRDGGRAEPPPAQNIGRLRIPRSRASRQSSAPDVCASPRRV